LRLPAISGRCLPTRLMCSTWVPHACFSLFEMDVVGCTACSSGDPSSLCQPYRLQQRMRPGWAAYPPLCLQRSSTRFAPAGSKRWCLLPRAYAQVCAAGVKGQGGDGVPLCSGTCVLSSTFGGVSFRAPFCDVCCVAECSRGAPRFWGVVPCLFPATSA